jgi:hypothetical protein
MYSRIFDQNDFQTRWFHHDEETDEITIETVTDFDLSNIKEHYASTDERARYKDEIMNHVGIVPMTILTDFLQRYPDDKECEKALLRWLDDSDNRCFRSRPGSLSR